MAAALVQELADAYPIVFENEKSDLNKISEAQNLI